jgi:hypothetical protein
MPRVERVHRWYAVAAALVWLCLALIATGAHASSSATQEVRAVPVPAHAVTSQGMPEAGHCMPCALCYVAPAPSSHVVTVEGNQFESFARWVDVPPLPAEPRALSNPRSREHVPIRVSFCRWLD